MEQCWRWYDSRILLFNHFFGKKPVYDDEMAVWVLHEKYLFILTPTIRRNWSLFSDGRVRFFNPLSWLAWLLNFGNGVKPTNKSLFYCLVRLSEIPDEVTLKQTIRALTGPPLKPGDLHDARDEENAEAAERMKARRSAQAEESK
jgi:hypothetical protein